LIAVVGKMSRYEWLKYQSNGWWMCWLCTARGLLWGILVWMYSELPSCVWCLAGSAASRLCTSTYCSCSVSNTPENPGNLLELCFSPGNSGNLLEIYKVSWKVSGLVCEFAHLSLILVIILYFRLCRYEISRSKPGSIDFDVSNLGKCQLIHLLIRW